MYIFIYFTTDEIVNKNESNVVCIRCFSIYTIQKQKYIMITIILLLLYIFVHAAVKVPMFDFMVGSSYII